MKAIVYGNGIESRILPTPTTLAAPGQHVLVRVHAAGLNPVDAKNVFGDKLPQQWTTGHNMIKRYLKNKIIGFDFAGTVVEVEAPCRMRRRRSNRATEFLAPCLRFKAHVPNTFVRLSIKCVTCQQTIVLNKRQHCHWSD